MASISSIIMYYTQLRLMDASVNCKKAWRVWCYKDYVHPNDLILMTAAATSWRRRQQRRPSCSSTRNCSVKSHKHNNSTPTSGQSKWYFDQAQTVRSRCPSVVGCSQRWQLRWNIQGRPSRRNPETTVYYYTEWDHRLMATIPSNLNRFIFFSLTQQ